MNVAQATKHIAISTYSPAGMILDRFSQHVFFARRTSLPSYHASSVRDRHTLKHRDRIADTNAVLSIRRRGSPQLLIDRAVQHPSELLPQSCQACAINCGKLPGFLQVLIDRSAQRTKLLSICGFHTMWPVNIATEV